MKYTLLNVKDISRKYPLDYLDCFERPMTIACYYLKPEYEYLYIVFRKMYQTFFFNGEGQNDIFKDYEKELGIKCVKVDIENNLIETIIDILDQGYPVLVPGNLRGLYYSRQYLHDDWPHLFLIKGYDKEKELFHMLDSTQLETEDDNPVYANFSIKFQILREIFEMYKWEQAGRIYYNKLVEESEVDYAVRVRNCLELLCDCISKRTYIEYAIMRGKEKQVSYNEIVNCAKGKKLLLECLIECLKIISIDTKRLEEIMEKIGKCWTEADLNLIHTLMKRNEIEKSYFDESKELQLQEKELLDALSKIQLLLQENSPGTQMEKTKYLYENNEDGIITHDLEKYIFCFNKDKNYNFWLKDNAPKVLVYSERKPLNRFLFLVKCEVMEDCLLEGHVKGIFIATTTGAFFGFGLDHLRTFVFEQFGVATKRCTAEPFVNRKVLMYMKLEQQRLSYGIIEGEEREFGYADFDESILRIGFYCKTWSNCQKLKISFYDEQLIF